MQLEALLIMLPSTIPAYTHLSAHSYKCVQNPGWFKICQNRTFYLQSTRKQIIAPDLRKAIPSNSYHETLTLSLMEKRHRDLVLIDTLLKATFVHHWSRVKIRVPPRSDQQPYVLLSVNFAQENIVLGLLSLGAPSASAVTLWTEMAVSWFSLLKTVSFLM